MSAARPRLSVLVVARDQAGAVRQLLTSLAQQALPRAAWELVLVDDGSTDALAEVAQEFEARIPLCLVRQRPSGPVSARLLGLYLARGDAILALEPDDVAPPGLLQAHDQFHRVRTEKCAGLAGPLRPVADPSPEPASAALWRADPILAAAGRHRQAGSIDLRDCWGARWSVKRAFVVELHGSHHGPVTGGHPLELAARLRAEQVEMEFSEVAACWSAERLDLASACRRMSALGAAAIRIASVRRKWRLRPWLGQWPGWSLLVPLLRLVPGPSAALRASLLAGLREARADVVAPHRVSFR